MLLAPPIYAPGPDMQQPLSLSDQELDVVYDLSRPLDPLSRTRFLEAIAAELGRYRPEQIGVGLIARIARNLQHGFVSPPSQLHERHRVW
jgi:hypothetical protein